MPWHCESEAAVRAGQKHPRHGAQLQMIPLTLKGEDNRGDVSAGLLIRLVGGGVVLHLLFSILTFGGRVRESGYVCAALASF